MNKFFRAMIIFSNYLLAPIYAIITIPVLIGYLVIKHHAGWRDIKDFMKAYVEGTKMSYRINKEFWKDGDIQHFGEIIE